jgi:hypothetical protein
MSVQRDYIAGVSSYFSSRQFKDFLKLLTSLDERSHVHMFVNTDIHPVSFETVLKKYLSRIGLPVNRGNEILIGGPNQGTLHGVHPTGTPHFDIKWYFKAGVGIEPMEDWRAEQEQNLLYWDEKYMSYFYRNYQWNPVGSTEIKAIEAYFDSRHWRHSFELMRDPDIVHIHPHVQTNVYPGILEGFLRTAIAKTGWKLQRMLQNVYHIKGIYYGKFMLLFKEPEMSFDFDWVYNRDIVLAPFEGDGLIQDEPGYMIIKNGLMDAFLAKDPYRTLSEREIDDCLRAIEYPIGAA